MVAQFLRLKLTILGNTFRRSPVQLLGMLIALLYGVGLALLAAGGLVTLRLAGPEIARTIVLVFGTLVVLGFALLPLAFGVDDPIDSRRFSLYGIATNRLAASLAVAALISVPAIVVAIFSVAQVVTWARDPLSTLLALLVAPLIVATCVLAARVSSAFASLYLTARRAREVVGVLLITVVVALAQVIAVIASIDWGSRGLPIMRRVAAIVAWTPFGAVWGVPADAAIGRTDQAVAKLVIAVAVVVVLWLAWRALVARMLVTPMREATARRYSGLGWFDVMPDNAGGVIAARSLSYWGRDARYRVTLGVIPIVPIIMVAALLIGGVPPEIITWLPVPVMCLFLGWTIHNDLAHDSTAFWIHVAANTPGIADRWGRTVPPLLLGAPLVLIGSIVSCAVASNWAALPGLIGLSAGVLLIGLGISSFMSAAFPYPAVRPGDSPFAQPQAAGTAGSVVQSLSFAGTAILVGPLIYLVFLGETVASQWHFVALAVGLATGVLALIAGVVAGGRRVSHRGPELLAFTLRN